MLQNAYLLAKIGVDAAENERNFAENLPKIGKNWQNLALPGAPRRGRGEESGRRAGWAFTLVAVQELGVK